MTFLLIVTLTSMLLAAIMSVVAWRMSGDERRRSDARVAALSAEIHQPMARASAAGTELFEPRRRSGSRGLAVVAGGVLAVSAVAIAILGGGRLGRPPRAANRAAAPAATPLELVALGHERDGDQLTVRGIVRIPPTGAGMDRLTAVVSLFAPDGGFLASGSAAVEARALRPGAESAFAVTVPRAGEVGRYRVSFTTDDRVVPHLDRRHES